VLAGEEVLGVFSYRSFALGAMELPAKERDPLALGVDQFLEDLAFASIHDELGSVLDQLDLRDAVLVGSETRLLGIVTDQDALRYFYGVASPYVMLREIELALRELLRASADEATLRECIAKTLGKHYGAAGRAVPEALEDLAFHDYLQILRFQETFPIFQPAFGGTPHTVHAKLAAVPDLRNAIFHFRRELTAEEFDLLRDRRDWLWKRVRRIEAARTTEETG